jgi:hypothetical protein
MKYVFCKMAALAISILILMAVVPVTFGASENENIILDQYELSFDLNTSLDHTIEVQPPVVGDNSTNYAAYIQFTNQTQILMGIVVSNNATDSTFEPELRYVKCIASRDKNATVTTRSVDDKIGIQTSSLSKSGDPTFTYRSWLDSKKCDCGEVFAGTTKLEILGMVPENISANLLNTLHVESLANAPMPDQPNAQPKNMVQLSGEHGAAIAKEMQSLPPLNASPSVITSKPYPENSWLDSFAPDDPAYHYLYAWANEET